MQESAESSFPEYNPRHEARQIFNLLLVRHNLTPVDVEYFSEEFLGKKVTEENLLSFIITELELDSDLIELAAEELASEFPSPQDPIKSPVYLLNSQDALHLRHLLISNPSEVDLKDLGASPRELGVNQGLLLEQLNQFNSLILDASKREENSEPSEDVSSVLPKIKKDQDGNSRFVLPLSLQNYIFSMVKSNFDQSLTQYAHSSADEVNARFTELLMTDFQEVFKYFLLNKIARIHREKRSALSDKFDKMSREKKRLNEQDFENLDTAFRKKFFQLLKEQLSEQDSVLVGYVFRDHTDQNTYRQSSQLLEDFHSEELRPGERPGSESMSGLLQFKAKETGFSVEILKSDMRWDIRGKKCLVRFTEEGEVKFGEGNSEGEVSWGWFFGYKC